MFTHPFRGSAAIAAGKVTRNQLRGPHFQRLFRDVYVSASVEPTLGVRASGAYLLAAGRGVVGGYAAAEWLDGSCGPRDAPVEVVVPAALIRPQPGLVVRRDVLLPNEVTTVARIRVTTARRTAFDLGRRPPRLDAVVAVDALARVGQFAPAELATFASRHLGAKGNPHLREVLRLARTGVGSPAETRIRLAIVDGGLPEPDVQHPVGRYALDLAYPAIRLGIEYDGNDHLTPERARRDLNRQAYVTGQAWTIVRIPPADAFHRPRRVASRVRDAIIAAGRELGLDLETVLLMPSPASAPSGRPRRSTSASP